MQSKDLCRGRRSRRNGFTLFAQQLVCRGLAVSSPLCREPCGTTSRLAAAPEALSACFSMTRPLTTMRASYKRTRYGPTWGDWMSTCGTTSPRPHKARASKCATLTALGSYNNRTSRLHARTIQVCVGASALKACNDMEHAFRPTSEARKQQGRHLLRCFCFSCTR